MINRSFQFIAVRPSQHRVERRNRRRNALSRRRGQHKVGTRTAKPAIRIGFTADMTDISRIANRVRNILSQSVSTMSTGVWLTRAIRMRDAKAPPTATQPRMCGTTRSMIRAAFGQRAGQLTWSLGGTRATKHVARTASFCESTGVRPTVLVRSVRPFRDRSTRTAPNFDQLPRSLWWSIALYRQANGA